MNVVEILETRYLPMLNQAAGRVGEKHPTFTISVGSGSLGASTTFPGHQIYLEAFRPHSADPEPNCLALEITVEDLPGVPRLGSLGVAWGGDGVPPSDGLDLLPTDIGLTPDTLRNIEEALPLLFDHFERCLCDWETAFPLSAPL